MEIDEQESIWTKASEGDRFQLNHFKSERWMPLRTLIL